MLQLAPRFGFGIIPAHAGSTGSRVSGQPHTQDHPRSRGEHRCCTVAIVGDAGSSPLTRGAPVSMRGRHGMGRIIPAHAGSTEEIRAHAAELQDHPRSRGEHSSPASPRRAQ